MFEKRSYQLERIDTGDYTPAEYERFLREIRFINRYLGDFRALHETLLRELAEQKIERFSVLDVGAGSGEFLREIAKFARKKKLQTILCGLELNERSAQSILEESAEYPEISSVRGDALKLPFAGGAFDYAICSLFTHHFTDENIILILREMRRVARRGLFIIDLHRHRQAYFFYKIFCTVFRISPLVREDGLLSILRSFKAEELQELGRKAGLENISVQSVSPARLVLKSSFDR